jgi:hypothetical protein
MIVAAIVIVLPAAAAQEYPIRFTNPAQVGDRAETSWSATQKTKTTMNVDEREKNQDENRKVEVEGIEEVRRVDGKGMPTRIAITIKRCEEISADGKKRTIASPGRVLTMVSRNKETQYTLDSGRLSAMDQGLLRLALNIQEEGVPNDDDTFGTKKPQAIGASWPVNTKAMTQRLREQSYDPVDPKQVKGTVKLVGVEDVPDIGPCLHVEFDFTVMNMTGSSNGYKMEDGDFECIDAALVPIGKGDCVQESSASQFHQVYTATFGDKPVRVESHSVRTLEVHRKPLPQKPATQPSTTQPATIPSTRPTPHPLATTTATATANATTKQVR